MAPEDQCGLSQFFFSGVDPNRFAYPQTRWPFLPGTFILYRILLAGYQVAVFTLVLLFWGVPPYYSPVDDKAKWFIYSSNWAYLVTVLYTLWTALTTVYWHMRGENRNSPGFFYYAKEVTEQYPGQSIELSQPIERRSFTAPMPWYFKVTWFLQVIACSSELATTAFFWVLRSELEYYSINFFTLNVHGVSLALVTFDFLVSANPCRILHSIYIGLFGLMYYLFTYMYHSLGGFNPRGGTYIYEELLDWEMNPMLTALIGIIVVIVGCPPLHIIFFLLYLIKMGFAKCCVCCSFRIPGEGTMS